MQPAFTTSIFRSLPSPTRAISRCVARPRYARLSTRPSIIRWRSSAAPAPVDTARTAIESEKVVVFSTTYCPYCAQVKSLLTSLNAPMAVFELDAMGSDGTAIREFLTSETGQRTVPNVFIGGKHVGGCDGLFETLCFVRVVAMRLLTDFFACVCRYFCVAQCWLAH